LGKRFSDRNYKKDTKRDQNQGRWKKIRTAKWGGGRGSYRVLMALGKQKVKWTDEGK